MQGNTLMNVNGSDEYTFSTRGVIKLRIVRGIRNCRSRQVEIVIGYRRSNDIDWWFAG